MTMELLAVPPALAHIHALRLCPAKCLGGVRPEAFDPVEDSELERALGPECPTCGGTGIDPSCYEGCCDGDDQEHGRATITFDPEGGGSFDFR